MKKPIFIAILYQLILVLVCVNSNTIKDNRNLVIIPAATNFNPTLSAQCRKLQSNCTDNVYPYLKEAQYMFPTSLEHVNHMCK